MSKRWALRLLLAVMLLAAFSAAASADEGDGWYDASQEEYFWQDQQEVVFPDVTPEDAGWRETVAAAMREEQARNDSLLLTERYPAEVDREAIVIPQPEGLFE